MKTKTHVMHSVENGTSKETYELKPNARVYVPMLIRGRIPSLNDYTNKRLSCPYCYESEWHAKTFFWFKDSSDLEAEVEEMNFVDYIKLRGREHCLDVFEKLHLMKFIGEYEKKHNIKVYK